MPPSTQRDAGKKSVGRLVRLRPPVGLLSVEIRGCRARAVRSGVPSEQSTDGNIAVLEPAVLSGLVTSESEARRLIANRGLKLDSETATDEKLLLTLELMV